MNFPDKDILLEWVVSIKEENIFAMTLPTLDEAWINKMFDVFQILK